MNPIDATAAGIGLAAIVGLVGWTASTVVVWIADLLGLTWSVKGEEKSHRNDPPAKVRPGARW